MKRQTHKAKKPAGGSRQDGGAGCPLCQLDTETRKELNARWLLAEPAEVVAWEHEATVGQLQAHYAEPTPQHGFIRRWCARGDWPFAEEAAFLFHGRDRARIRARILHALDRMRRLAGSDEREQRLLRRAEGAARQLLGEESMLLAHGRSLALARKAAVQALADAKADEQRVALFIEALNRVYPGKLPQPPERLYAPELLRKFGHVPMVLAHMYDETGLRARFVWGWGPKAAEDYARRQFHARVLWQLYLGWHWPAIEALRDKRGSETVKDAFEAWLQVNAEQQRQRAEREAREQGRAFEDDPLRALLTQESRDSLYQQVQPRLRQTARRLGRWTTFFGADDLECGEIYLEIPRLISDYAKENSTSAEALLALHRGDFKVLLHLRDALRDKARTEYEHAKLMDSLDVPLVKGSPETFADLLVNAPQVLSPASRRVLAAQAETWLLGLQGVRSTKYRAAVSLFCTALRREADWPKRNSELGEELGCTPQRAGQLRAQLVERLREKPPLYEAIRQGLKESERVPHDQPVHLKRLPPDDHSKK